MKKVKSLIFKRIFSLVCALAMLVSFIPVVSAAPDATELPFVLMNESYAFNARTVAAVIDLGEGNSADGAALTKDMFSVNARTVREGTTTQVYNGARTIIDVYANEANTWKTDTTVNNAWAPPSTRGNGRYIVIKFKDWDGGGENPDGGSTTASGQSLTPVYTITANSNISLVGGSSISDASFIQKDVTGLIEDEFIASSITGNGQTTMYSYFLNKDAEGPLPLVIHFHGAQQGAHAKSPLRYSNNGTVWAYPENQAKNPCHVLVPSNGNSYTSAWTAGHIQNTATIVRQMIDDGLVDPNRVYVTGYSMGGTGTMQFLSEFPDLVAAAAPICIAQTSNAALNATNAAKYADVPIWAFVNKGDSTIYNGMNTFFNTGVGKTVLTNARYSVINNNETFVYPYVWTEYVGWDKSNYPADAPNGVWDFGAHCSWIPVHNNKLADMAFQNPEDFDFASENGYEYVADWMFSHGAPEAPVLSVTTDGHLVKKGGYFHVTASFAEEVKSNTAVLNYEFDTTKFDYRGFTPAEGSTVISAEKTDTGVKIILMIPDYKTLNYGEVLLSAKEDVDLENKDNEIKLYVDYVVLNEQDEKEVRHASASTTFTSTDDKPGTGEDGEVTLIDLSNMIDLFGMDKTNPDWEKYRFYDYNNNGMIDIHDISTLASRIK